VIYVLDPINEPEGMIEHTDNIISHEIMRKYISECSERIKIIEYKSECGMYAKTSS
jgi:hypothetical protein